MDRRNIKVNILSAGRFHVLDLARELDKQGFDVKFYSYVPPSRCQKFGLPRRCCASYFLVAAPLLALDMLAKRVCSHERFISDMNKILMDYFVGIVMRKCDVLIAMSGEFVYSLKVAKKNNAVVIVERGSKHILEQKRILESIVGGVKPSRMDVDRELKCYDLADFVCVPAEHVREGFIKLGISNKKIFVNHYGVNMDMFNPDTCAGRKFDVIMVGLWSYQKGCDLLSKAIIGTGITLLHVGALGDCPFPDDVSFKHIDHVDQSRLNEFYNSARVFALPSRQEGLALVLCQAMACGLPIVCTRDSGGEDLRNLLTSKEWIEIVKFDPDSILSGIKIQLDRAKQHKTNSSYMGEIKAELTWDAYGIRYGRFLEKIAKQ